MKIPHATLCGCLLILMLLRPAPAAELKIVSFNVESGYRPHSDLSTIAAQLRRYRTVDLWALSEVNPSGWTDTLLRAAELGASARFGAVAGTTSHDRLLILYNTHRLELLASFELMEMQEGSGGRAPLVARLRERASGREFLFMANHLHRTDGAKRRRQAAALNRWAREQSLPVIAAGDYNFDWNIEAGTGPQRDPGFDLMTADDVFAWIRPDTLVSTQCNPNYNSVLDFVFVSGEAKQWTRESSILETDPAYCVDTPRTSDHRPVEAVIVVPDLVPGEAPGASPTLSGSPAPHSGPHPTSAPPSTPAASSPTLSVKIFAALPNPSGVEEEDEAIHLHNLTHHSISLNGWRLQDAASTSWLLTDADGALEAGRTLIIRRKRRPMALNNSGDTISLFAPGALQPHHSVRYTAAPEDWVISFP